MHTYIRYIIPTVTFFLLELVLASLTHVYPIRTFLQIIKEVYWVIFYKMASQGLLIILYFIDKSHWKPYFVLIKKNMNLVREKIAHLIWVYSVISIFMMLKRSETATAILQDSWYLYYWDTILFLSNLFNNLKGTFLSHSGKHLKHCWNRSLETRALTEISN